MAKLLYYLASASYFTANSHQPQLHTQTTSFFPSPLAVRPLHSFFSFSAIHHLPFLYLHACMSLICFSCVQLFATLWSVAHQAPLSMGFSRQEYQSGLPCLPPGVLPTPCIEPMQENLHLLHWQVGSLSLAPPGKPFSLLIPLQFFLPFMSHFRCHLLQKAFPNSPSTDSVQFSRSVMSNSL